MNTCDKSIQRFTLAGQASGIKELRDHEVKVYESIYNDLMSKHIEACGEVPEGLDIQVINKVYTHDGENITPMGLVNVSLEYLARILTFAKGRGIQWQIDSKECSTTHFKKLSHFTVNVNCEKDQFVAMAKEFGFRY
ncbi:hypothetical protein Desaci_2937 [Desulfosporosinus acidiphilus SJ4]|uniref:Uncharacterized protein n=1 Tax=Desulfosporosinus acidiphilus (strain DSM 22704 / JCM 16185 / SJ4) TaxID=646529 RepID=I4D7S4_DESAJ|nr:hypothetical protein [Desulfosporosinus acidiphilus]AFM41848.1 hypothetical protein Desaci_2937 [Desulfosporosinus acidiphilus SJ4]